MIGSTPKITVWGLMIDHLPITLVRSGAVSLSSFEASTLPLVKVPGHPDQPAAVSITGNSGVNSITFTIRILPTVSATFQFGHVDYAGTGPRTP
jgi:hypothetical protein